MPPAYTLCKDGRRCHVASVVLLAYRPSLPYPGFIPCPDSLMTPWVGTGDPPTRRLPQSCVAVAPSLIKAISQIPSAFCLLVVSQPLWSLEGSTREYHLEPQVKIQSFLEGIRFSSQPSSPAVWRRISFSQLLPHLFIIQDLQLGCRILKHYY